MGKNVLQLSPGLSTVPLLDPTSDSLPFAASLQIYSSDDRAAALSSSTQQDNHQHASTLVELHYVISGGQQAWVPCWMCQAGRSTAASLAVINQMPHMCPARLTTVLMADGSVQERMLAAGRSPSMHSLL